MRLLHQDPKFGLLRLRIETPSDLWRAARLIRIGDRVGASTTRRDPEAPADTKAADRERRRVWLVVTAEQVEFGGFASPRLRVAGPIVEGPFDQGRHHTLELSEGSELTVQKGSIGAADRALLDEGVEARGEPLLLLASVDWGDSSLVRLRGRMVQPVADVSRTLPGKRFGPESGEKERKKYLEEVTSLLAAEVPAATAVVVAGPGFFKERLAESLIEKLPEAKGKLRLLSASESGPAGVQEVLRSGRASETLRGSVAAEEAGLVERLVEALGGGRRAAVGPRETAEALGVGAVETLLVNEERLPDAATVALLERAREGRVRVFIVASQGEAAGRLRALGGIAGLLRFDWTPSTPRRAGPGA